MGIFVTAKNSRSHTDVDRSRSVWGGRRGGGGGAVYVGEETLENCET